MAEILLARARDVVPERLVVLKRMHRQLAVDREFVDMFVDEARIALTLRHPNVVEVYEIGEDGDQSYIVMEYLHGHDLRRVLGEMAKRQISIRLSNALAIIHGVCRGLDYTHERTNEYGESLGIVHRDVSPHNVLLTYNGKVKLVDFGIAKTSSQMSRTRTGILKGKVAYMSPEQAMGEQLDRRSDVFCIGILLWEMTTGQWLYRRKSELETLKAVVELDAPLPSTVHPHYPRELEQIVKKTLARRPDDRWATAGELGDALAEFARRRRINLEPAMLGAMMSSIFPEEVAAWQDARRAGASLGTHLVAEAEREDRESREMTASERSGSGSGHSHRRRLGSDSEGAGGGLDKFDSPTMEHGPEWTWMGERDRERAALDNFDSPTPTVDHMLDGWPDGAAPEMEDQPTTILQPRSASSGEQPVARGSTPSGEHPTIPLPALHKRDGALTPTPTPTPMKVEPHVSVPGLGSMPQRWLWLALGAMLAVVAAVWLVSVILHR